MALCKLRTASRLLGFAFFLATAFLYSEQYRIRSVNYDITGITRKYPLSKVADINTHKIFANKTKLEAYLQDRLAQLKSQRVLQDAFIVPSFGTEDNEGIIPVDILISTTDTWNIIALPYPKYDSNSGFVFKIKIKDYNFLGTMRTLSGDIAYEYETKSDKTQKHKIGGGFSFAIPFKTGIFDSNWTNDFSVDYEIGESAPKVDFKTGISFALPLYKIVSLDLGFSQSVKYNPEYRADKDSFYLNETAFMRLPVALAKSEEWGDISWVPSLSASWNWDPTQANGRWNGISRSDLQGPDIKVAHGFNIGRVNWIGNYRQGYSVQINQSFLYDAFFDTYTTSSALSGEYYHAFKYAGFASRYYLFKNFGSASAEGSRIRGVRDKYIETDSALLVNIDVPVKILQTDWVGRGGPRWMSWFDFEMQLSPFIDIAVGNNSAAGTYYNPKDGWYATGLEIIGFPNKARSIQGRISFGVDAVLFAQKAGEKIPFVAKVVNEIFDTDWRTGSWYELSVGIGLHY